MRTSTPHQPALTELLAQLRQDVTTLVQQEVALARTELREIAATVARNAALLAVALVAAAGAALLLLAAAAYAVWVGLLAAGLPAGVAMWLAPLVVGLVIAAVAALLVHRALSALRRRPLVPRETLASLAETGQWIKERAS